MSWKVIKPVSFNPYKINGVEYKNAFELIQRIEELEKELAISEHDREHNDYELTEVYKKISGLEQQIEKMKCCGNCRFSESDSLNGTFCHREGCFVVASAGCKLWER